MRYPTKSVGDSTLVQQLIVSTGSCKLASVVGYNNGAGAFAMIFEKAAVPANGQKAKFSFPIDAARAYSFVLNNPVDMDACCVAISSTPDTYTAAAGTPVTIQAIVAS